MTYAIGIDLGGTAIKYALVNANGALIEEGQVATPAKEGAEAIISTLKKIVGGLQIVAANRGVTPTSIGIGTPGIVDEQTGTVLGGAENLAGWENIPLAEILNTFSGLPVSVNNDANVMGLAEAAFGAAKGCTDVIFLTIGTGIGGAIIINGKLFGGYKNRGTELGHIPFIANGEPCACGAVGCLEHYASAAAMVRRYKEKAAQQGLQLPAEVDGRYITQLYHQGDITAQEAIHENCRYLGQAIAGFINIFSPQKVVIGGGLADAGDFYIERIRQETARFVLSDCAINTTIERASLGNRAGCLGATVLNH